MSSNGVPTLGRFQPRAAASRSNRRKIFVFAKCRQFQVSRWSASASTADYLQGGVIEESGRWFYLVPHSFSPTNDAIYAWMRDTLEKKA